MSDTTQESTNPNRPADPPDTSRLVDITLLAFPDLLPEGYDPNNLAQYDTESVVGHNDELLAENHKAFFERDDVIVSTATDESGEITGYALALPVAVFDESRGLDTDTAYVYYTAVDPNMQGRGIIWDVKKRLFSELFQKGFRYVEIDVTHEHGYAEKMSRIYEQVVEAQADHFSEEFDTMQRFLRLKLTPAIAGVIAVENS